MIIQAALIKPSESHNKLKVIGLRKGQIGGADLDKSLKVMRESRGREWSDCVINMHEIIKELT